MREEKYMQGIKLKKSKNFLYPLTGIKNVRSDCDTFLYWTETDQSIDDYHLIVYFKTDYDEDYQMFEEQYIADLDSLVGCHVVEDGRVYIFSLITYHEEVDKFMKGNYSQFNIKTKHLIMEFFGDDPKKKEIKTGRTHYMILFPALFKDAIADELGVDDLGLLNELAPLYEITEEICEAKLIGDCNCGDKLTYYQD
jgi:hypothetical protein